jgi:hypothetical protein
MSLLLALVQMVCFRGNKALPDARSRRYRPDPTMHKIKEKTELRL